MDAYLAFRCLGVIVPRLPVRLGYAAADWLADRVYQWNIQAVRGLRANIRHALGPSASVDRVEAAVHQAYRHLCKNYLDLFRLAALTTEQLRSAVELAGWENVQAARALGRGVVLCSPHLGNTEAGLNIVAATGIPVVGPAEHIEPERLFCYLTHLRTRHGMRLIPSDGLMLDLFRALRRGEALGVVLDRDTTGSGVEAMLCGERARLPDGYARLAAKTRSPVVVGLCHRLPDGRARAEFDAMFVPELSASRDDVYRAALDFGVRELERAITRYPDQWVLTTPIWI